MGTVHWRKTDARYKKGFPMTVAVPTITDVVFDFCGVLLDWRTRTCLEGRFDDATVDRICADDDPCGFFGYEDRMDAGEDFDSIWPDVVAEQENASPGSSVITSRITTTRCHACCPAWSGCCAI